MAVWPSSLPQEFLRDGYTEAPTDNVIRFPVTQGPTMGRPRYTRSVIIYKGYMLMTDAQYET